VTTDYCYQPTIAHWTSFLLCRWSTYHLSTTLILVFVYLVEQV
jgi:hypothetical protein